ncbi:unnamed protein product [Meganyctiphanes norvegica]|uniref:Uncharacterized protein n=1 Tax=Meganyctiphanes norvegica TaxID=48144 RepID=A0AAV2RGT8_MEGNR
MADNGSLFQEIRDILSVDNDEKVMTLCNKLTQLSGPDFSKLLNEHVKLIFSNRHWDDLITIKDVLVNPEKCSDPYIRLGLMCFTLIFLKSITSMRQDVFITISQIVVDNYIPYVEGHLFNSHILIDLINDMRENEEEALPFSQVIIDITGSARNLKKYGNDLLDKFYANLIDLFAKLILIEIKCINFKNMSDAMLVSNDIVKFFDIYYGISEFIVEKHPTILLLIDKSVKSAIAVITNCILLFQAKLIASDIDFSNWSDMICMMEKLRDHMIIFMLPSSSGSSLRRFILERAHGNFNTNCTKKLYAVTNYIDQVNTSERSSDTYPRNSLQTFRFVLYDLKQHINSICSNFNIQHRAINKLYSVDEHYSSIEIEEMNAFYSSDESLTSSESEDSNSETDGEADDLSSDDEIRINGNEDTRIDENSEDNVQLSLATDILSQHL